MKKITVFIIGLMCITNVLYAQIDEQLPYDILQESKEMGIISYMTTLKTLAESQMIVLATNEEYSKDSQKERVKEINTAYSLLKLAVDRFVNQLSADMINKNKIKYYRKINKFIINTDDGKEIAKCVEKYQTLSELIDKRAEVFLGKEFNNLAAIPLIDEILGVADLTKSIIKEERDFKEKKITKMIALMNKLTLDTKKDLIKNATDVK